MRMALRLSADGPLRLSADGPQKAVVHGWPADAVVHGWPADAVVHGWPADAVVHGWPADAVVHGWPAEAVVHGWPAEAVVHGWPAEAVVYGMARRSGRLWMAAIPKTGRIRMACGRLRADGPWSSACGRLVVGCVWVALGTPSRLVVEVNWIGSGSLRAGRVSTPLVGCATLVLR